MLKSQREEVDRLRSVSKQLTTQNEGLLVKVQNLQCDQRDAEKRAEDSQRLAKTLETHTRDMAKQMAILVQEIRRLSGEGPGMEQGPRSLVFGIPPSLIFCFFFCACQSCRRIFIDLRCVGRCTGHSLTATVLRLRERTSLVWSRYRTCVLHLLQVTERIPLHVNGFVWGVHGTGIGNLMRTSSSCS